MASSDYVKRNFYYYDYVLEKFDIKENLVTEYENSVKNLVMIKVIQKIKNLEYCEDDFSMEKLISKNKDGNYTYLIVDEESEEHIHFRLVFGRDRLLPYTELNGDIEPLSKLLKKRQKLAEITHCVFFKKENIFSLEYNFSGGKVKDLRDYIIDKSNREEIAMFNIFNLVNIDTLKKIKKDEQMSLLDIKVRTGSEIIADLIREDEVFEGLNCKKDNVEEVSLCLKSKVTSKKPGFFINMNKETIRDIFKKKKQDITKFRIKYGYGMEQIDLLSENFVFCDNFIPIENTKTIKKEDAYEAMVNYFNKEIKKYYID